MEQNEHREISCIVYFEILNSHIKVKQFYSKTNKYLSRKKKLNSKLLCMYNKLRFHINLYSVVHHLRHKFKNLIIYIRQHIRLMYCRYQRNHWNEYDFRVSLLFKCTSFHYFFFFFLVNCYLITIF